MEVLQEVSIEDESFDQVSFIEGRASLGARVGIGIIVGVTTLSSLLGCRQQYSRYNTDTQNNGESLEDSLRSYSPPLTTREYQRRYGSFENPRYQAEHSFPEALDPTFLSFLENRIETLESLLKTRNTRNEAEDLHVYSEALREFEEISKDIESGIAFQDREHLLQFWQEKVKSLCDIRMKICNQFNVSDIDVSYYVYCRYFGELDDEYELVDKTKVSEKALREKYGSPIQLAHHLFPRVVGYNLPNSIHIDIAEPDSTMKELEAVGYNTGAEEYIRVNKNNFVSELCVLAHEIGHQICQLEEANGAFEFGQSSRGEAAAEMFAFIMISALSDRYLEYECREHLRSDRMERIQAYLRGEDTEDGHGLGAIIADAALTFYEPTEAFHHITTERFLDPKISHAVRTLQQKINLKDRLDLECGNKLDKEYKSPTLFALLSLQSKIRSCLAESQFKAKNMLQESIRTLD